MNGLNPSLSKFVACAILALGLASCSGGGSDGGGTTTPPAPASGSVTVTGTVSGTVIKLLHAETNTLIREFDTATLNQAPPFAFTLSNIPLDTKVRLFFITGGAVYPLHFGNPQTNVFKFASTGTVELGEVQTANGQAVLPNPPNGGVEFEPPVPDLPLPQDVTIQPPTVTVTKPSNNATVPSGPVDITFDPQHVTIGDKNHDHLHFEVDSESYEFINESTAGQILHNGSPAQNALWITRTKFQLLNLSSGSHTVTLELATASHIPFVNSQASASVQFTVDQPLPNPPATVTITSPSAGQTFLFGPVSMTFAVSNFPVQGQGQPQLHFYLDTDPNVYQFFNGPTNQVWYNGAPSTSVQRVSTSTFQFLSLTEGAHTVRLVLANGDGVATELTNTQATSLVSFIVDPPIGGGATLTLNSLGNSVPPGPVLVTFNIQNSPVAPSATLPRMQFYVDNNASVLFKFYDGSVITENGSTSGVRYQNAHTHFVHWKSGSSIQFNALASGLHQVNFVLLDPTGAPLAGTEKTLNFTTLQGTSSNLFLEEVVDGLNFPTAMATTPDGRIFVTEKSTGDIRVVTPKPQPQQWELQTTPFAHIDVQTVNEQGLLGIAVDPAFESNHFVYVFYTATSTINRIGRFTATTTSNGNTVAQSGTPTPIFEMPAAENHNGGVIQFGPDGMLYILLGENEINPNEAQNLSSLQGKILRINKNGTIPLDNPFRNNQSANPAIYSYGHRNGFGLTFHPHTKDLWETENGENAYDQINRIIPMGNYGWPIVDATSTDPRYINPALIFEGYSPPTIAPTGIVAIGEDSIYPAQYHNNLLVADFNNGWLHNIALTGDLLNAVGETIVCQCGKGGLLSVMQGLNVPGQDRYIYVTNGDFFSSNHSIFRVRFNP